MKKKSMWIIGSIVVIALIVVIGVALKIVIGGNSKGVYGNRLDGIENYAISDSKIEEIKTKILENKECEKITYNKQGRILKFFLTVTKDTGVTTAQRLGDNIVDSFSETELGYYDVTIYVESGENTEPYPMIGYKNKNEKAISWTVNKGEVKDEE